MQKHKFNIFPLMQSDDYSRLKDDLTQNGFDTKNPIYTYQGHILDGWNRYRACSELNIQPALIEFTGTDTEALDFVMRTNKRRNLNSSQWAAIAVEADEMVSAIRERVENERREKIRESMGSNKNASKEKQISQLIDESVIDIQFTPVLSQFDCPEIVDEIPRNDYRTDQKLASTFNTNRTYINEASRLRREKPELFEQVKRGEVTIPETKKPHVSNNSGEHQWYTPEHIIEAARTTMGCIDVDPASSQLANSTVKAHTYYTESNNGLTKEWNGNVWMNPPYAQPLISQFVEKLIEKFLSGEVKKACVLVNNATDTTWFHSIVRISSAICFTKGRVRFIDVNGNPGAPLQGQAIIYIGKTDAYKFCETFSEIGFVLKNH